MFTVAGMQERELLTIPQAAKRIGLTRAVMWRHVQKGHLATVEAGPYRLIDAEELARFADNRRRPGRPRRAEPGPDERA